MTATINPLLCTWRQCSACISPVPPGDPVSARQWVGRFIGDDVMMARLRQMAFDAGAESSPAMCDDQSLADRITAGITAGSMRVCGPAQALTLLGLVAARPPVAAPARAAAPPRAAPVAPPPVAQTTFGPDLAVAAMVAVLVQAAQDGVPFCEECAKAAAATAAP